MTGCYLTGSRPGLVNIVTHPISAWALLAGQLRFMRKQGFRVTIISAPDPLLQKTAEREGVELIGVPMLREPAPLRDAAALGRMTVLLRKLRPEIAHIGTPKAGLLAGLAAVIAGVPVRLYTLHGIRADSFSGLRLAAFAGLERTACLSAHRVYCVSESLRRRGLELGVAPARKLTVLAGGSANGVDASHFAKAPELLRRARALGEELGLAEDVPVVGFVGRLVRDKGIVELVEAYHELRPEFPGLRLLLVGPFEGRDAVPPDTRAEIERGEQVVTTGFLEDIAPAYALMDVLALPTYREGFGNVAVEANAMELPVVATRVTGCVDAVVDGVTGTLVPPRDPKALADAIRMYLNDPDLRRKHGKAGRERVVRDFQPERIWEALFQEYVRLLRARGLPLPCGA